MNYLRSMIVMIALLLAMACGASVERQALDVTGLTVDRSVGAMRVQYERGGNDAIDAAADAAAATAALKGYRESWRELWESVQAFRAVHNTLSDASDRGGRVDLAALFAAYCALRLEALGRHSLPDLGCDQ